MPKTIEAGHATSSWKGKGVIVNLGDRDSAFVLHAVPRVMSFTGSTPVGWRIAELAAKSPMLKRVALELGGNSPFIILEDADLDLAINAAGFDAFIN